MTFKNRTVLTVFSRQNKIHRYGDIHTPKGVYIPVLIESQEFFFTSMRIFLRFYL
jgi:hypothetical protein